MKKNEVDLSEVDISLNIQNNTDVPQQISIMGSPFNPLDTANAKTEYRWDLTAFTFTTETNVSLQYRPATFSSFSLYQSILSTININGVLFALNALGIGYFYTYTSAGSTYIATYNDNNVFGNLSIYSSTSPQINYNFNASTVTGGSVNVDVNAVNVLSVANPAVQTGTVSASAGDTVKFYGNGTLTPNGFFSEVYDNGVLVFSSAVSPFTYTFVAAAGHVYDLNCFDTP